MPSLFRRKSSNLVTDAVAAADQAGSSAGTADANGTETGKRRGYTPSKRDRGVTTPKRRDPFVRRTVDPPPLDRREALKRERERARAERADRRRRMAEGDDSVLLPRDRGPERALVRDIVDSRMTVGTWFFAGALVVLVGSSAMMPLPVRFGANLLWLILAVATIIDSVVLSRQVKRLVRKRFPKTELRLGSLYFYAIMRALMFRRIRMPKPRVKLGTRL